jgi:isohexenylglutaconyl-CoA hydratase
VVILEGAVLGGGFGLACVSDVAISRDNTQFGLPETGLGVIPVSGKPNWVLSRLMATSETHARPNPPPNTAPSKSPFVVKRIGLTQARRLALLGMRFEGHTALSVGVASSNKSLKGSLSVRCNSALVTREASGAARLMC